MKTFFAVIFTAAAVLFSGCASAPKGNNHLAVEDLCDHLIASGVPVTQVQPIRKDVYGAMDAWAFQIDNRNDQEIGVYKFDITIPQMAKSLEKYEKRGYAMTLGLKFPVVVSGSFMLIGVEKNAYREKIVEALKTF